MAIKTSASIFSKLKRNLFKRNLEAGELIAQSKNVDKCPHGEIHPGLVSNISYRWDFTALI